MAIDSHNAPDPALHQAFFERAGTALLIVDDNSHIVEANTAARRLLQLDRGDDHDGGLLGAFWRVDSSAVLRLVDAVRRGVAVAPVAVRTASDRPVEVDAFRISDSEQPRFGVIVSDRSTAADAQRRLEDQEERYRSLFEWAPVPMREEDFTAVGEWLSHLRETGVEDLTAYMDDNPDDVIRAIQSIRTRRVNAASVEMLKAPSALAIMRGFRVTELTPQVVDAFREQFETLWDGGTTYESDFVGMNFEGQPFEVQLHWRIPESKDGPDLSRTAVSSLDLTQLRSTQRRLEALVAGKDRFIASVSHELRTPLAAVFGLAEEISSNWEKFDETELRDLVGLVAGQAEELSLIVEDLLVAANLDAGRVSIRPETIDLSTIAAAALADCQRSNTGLEHVTVTGSVVPAVADPVRVRQIIRNLITNAIRYGGETIEIQVGRSEQPYLRVIDDGDGVPLEHRETVFVPYFQSADGEKVLGSLGLGLAISRELARKMGGELAYRYADDVSVFQLDLPSG